MHVDVISSGPLEHQGSDTNEDCIEILQCAVPSRALGATAKFYKSCWSFDGREDSKCQGDPMQLEHSVGKREGRQASYNILLP